MLSEVATPPVGIAAIPACTRPFKLAFGIGLSTISWALALVSLGPSAAWAIVPNEFPKRASARKLPGAGLSEKACDNSPAHLFNVFCPNGSNGTPQPLPAPCGLNPKGSVNEVGPFP